MDYCLASTATGKQYFTGFITGAHPAPFKCNDVWRNLEALLLKAPRQSLQESIANWIVHDRYRIQPIAQDDLDIE
jgi:hypothetical protein